ncbi:MAG: pantoate--beta-alanine ligase [Gammaproteobacteria bacterium]|nr:pantoate--beta-alanine ligase [Gammaproteobacteria bacterium]
MLTVSNIPELRKVLGQWRAEGERIALVPTMGNLHRGHLQLVETAKAEASRVVVSIFVNPMQFDRENDLKGYPRTLEEDRQKLEGMGADLVFVPSSSEVYPLGMETATQVDVPGLSRILCGASRAGHFRGVTTIVTKLFNMVQPDVAVFGKKDYQQLLLIRRLVADLNIPVEVVAVATVRESDGLAMSSRNSYLSTDERRRAPLLYLVLKGLKIAIKGGAREYSKILEESKKDLISHGYTPDYLRILRQGDLSDAGSQDKALVILAAAWLGKARLIDNVLLHLKDDR